MTNDIEKIQTVDNTEHGLKLDSGILSYIRTGITNVKQALDALFSGKADTSHTHSTSEGWLSTIVNNLTTLINGKAASATTLAGYGITDAYTKTYIDTALAGKVNAKEINPNPKVSTPTDLDSLLTNNGDMGIFHLYNGDSNPAKLSDLVMCSSGRGIVIFGFDSNRTINTNSDVLFSMCKHEGHNIIFVHDKGALVTALSASSNDLQYPSAKCVYDELTGKANSSHPHSQSDISGLENDLNGKENNSNKIESWSELAGFGNAQYPCARMVKESLDKKLEATVNNLTATESAPADADDLTAGALYLIDNTRQVMATRPKLNQIITCDAGSGHHLCWHLDSGNLIKNYFMVRVFNWSKQVGATINTYHFVEVVGAWD